MMARPATASFFSTTPETGEESVRVLETWPLFSIRSISESGMSQSRRRCRVAERSEEASEAACGLAEERRRAFSTARSSSRSVATRSGL